MYMDIHINIHTHIHAIQARNFPALLAPSRGDQRTYLLWRYMETQNFFSEKLIQNPITINWSNSDISGHVASFLRRRYGELKHALFFFEPRLLSSSSSNSDIRNHRSSGALRQTETCLPKQMWQSLSRQKSACCRIWQVPCGPWNARFTCSLASRNWVQTFANDIWLEFIYCFHLVLEIIWIRNVCMFIYCMHVVTTWI